MIQPARSVDLLGYVRKGVIDTKFGAYWSDEKNELEA